PHGDARAAVIGSDMTAVYCRPPKPVSSEHFFGVRERGRLAVMLFRLPSTLSRHGCGRLLGRTFLVFTHVGRRTGRHYDTTAIVITFDDTTQEVVIGSAWGP